MYSQSFKIYQNLRHIFGDETSKVGYIFFIAVTLCSELCFIFLQFLSCSRARARPCETMIVFSTT